jgi:hypothetical protein
VHEKMRAVNTIDRLHFPQSYCFAVAAYMFEPEYCEHRLYCCRLVYCLNEHRSPSVFHFDCHHCFSFPLIRGVLRPSEVCCVTHCLTDILLVDSHLPSSRR